jgi:hypothetical protein
MVQKIRTERKCRRPSLQSSGTDRFLPIPVPALSFNLQNRDSIPILRDFSRETNELCARLGHYASCGPDTSVRNYHHTLRNVSEERRFHSHPLDRLLGQFGVLPKPSSQLSLFGRPQGWSSVSAGTALNGGRVRASTTNRLCTLVILNLTLYIQTYI